MRGGASPAVPVAVSAVARVAPRPACLVVGRALRRRSAAHVNALRAIAGGRLGARSRRRTGRPRRRWEDLRVSATGKNWMAEMLGRQ